MSAPILLSAPHRAMHALYSEHHGWLQNWLRGKLGCAADAADLAQDTFLRILLKRELREIGMPRAFLRTIARGLVMPYALVLSAGNDGRGAQGQLQRILSGIPFTAAAEPLIVRGEPAAQHLEQCRELGQGLAAGLAMGIY